ncbi:MAG TPA: DUF2180 family protein [Ktedonobacterales bacterium]
MNCYTCQREGHTMPAVAICQGCGAACCLEHVEERATPGHGLASMAVPRLEMLCQRCLGLRASALVGVGQSTSVPAKKAATGAPVLPNANEAISTVEALLRGERPAEASLSRWRRFFTRKRSL